MARRLVGALVGLWPQLQSAPGGFLLKAPRRVALRHLQVGPLLTQFFFGDLGESPSSLSREKLGLASLTARSDSTADAGNGICDPVTNTAGIFRPGGVFFRPKYVARSIKGHFQGSHMPM